MGPSLCHSAPFSGCNTENNAPEKRFVVYSFQLEVITMKRTARILTLLFGVIMLFPGAGQAYGPYDHFRGGIWISPIWEPWRGPYPYYYSSPRVIIERPTTDYYIQPTPEQRAEPAYWYYCRKPDGYYPYVKQCPGGWMKVVPTPPSENKDK